MKNRRSERGVTLIELMIAITLVAALSTGMLFAMRASLITYDKTDSRLRSSRRMMSLEEILTKQLGGLMPVPAECPATDGPPALLSAFSGSEETLHMVSSYSIAEGARGYPQILEFQVAPSDSGTVRLIVNEHPYTGPSSVRPLCLDKNYLPVKIDAASFVLEDHLQSCRFSYHDPYNPVLFTETPWRPLWTDGALPATVRVEMTPAPGDTHRLPLYQVTVPVRIDRDVFTQFSDR